MSHGYICIQHLRRTTDCKHYRTYEPSWIKEWESIMKKSKAQCLMAFKDGNRYVQCPNQAEVGAHVIDENQNVYIIPSCKKCNSDSLMEKRGHCMFAHRELLMPLPDCICVDNDERNVKKSRVQMLSVNRLDRANTVALSMPVSVSKVSLKDLFDEVELLMKTPKFPNYWDMEQAEHRREFAKYTKQYQAKCLDIRDLCQYIRDMLDPISVPRKTINDLIEKTKHI